jgi:tRNA(adenine34) deaminase
VSARQLFDTGYYNHVFSFVSGCMQAECSEQLSAFFKMRREQKRQIKLQQKQLLEKHNPDLN